jgi:hypothetical protein
MTAVVENRPPGRIAAFLAGLQGGMVGVLCMLAWLGVSSSWLRRSFWTSENLLAGAFFGDAAIRRGFAAGAVSGTALYLMIYSLLGGLFALVFRGQERQVRVLLLSLAFSMGWYYLSFHLLYRSVLPLVYLLQAERPMVLGHLVYGTFLSRYPGYLGGPRG